MVDQALAALEVQAVVVAPPAPPRNEPPLPEPPSLNPANGMPSGDVEALRMFVLQAPLVLSVLEDKRGYGRDFKRIERADKRERKEQRRAKAERRRVFAFVPWQSMQCF